jgi:hypothetical protein
MHGHAWKHTHSRSAPGASHANGITRECRAQARSQQGEWRRVRTGLHAGRDLPADGRGGLGRQRVRPRPREARAQVVVRQHLRARAWLTPCQTRRCRHCAVIVKCCCHCAVVFVAAVTVLSYAASSETGGKHVVKGFGCEVAQQQALCAHGGVQQRRAHNQPCSGARASRARFRPAGKI